MATIAQYRAILKGQMGGGKMGVLARCGAPLIDAGCRAQPHAWRDRFSTPLQSNLVTPYRFAGKCVCTRIQRDDIWYLSPYFNNPLVSPAGDVNG